MLASRARRARLDRRGAAREGSAAAASSAAGGSTSAIAELLAVAQLLAADGGRPEARVRPRRGPALETQHIESTRTRLGGLGLGCTICMQARLAVHRADFA